jgi:transcriptional regulator with XRE-family HTH domain
VRDESELRLVRELGQLLRRQRERRGLSQETLAIRADVTQQYLSRLERGVGGSGLAAMARLFAALQLRLTADVVPLGYELDDEIDRLRGRLAEEQAMWAGRLRWLRRYARDLPVVVDGPMAALLQGLPVPVPRIDLLIAESDLDLLAAWVARVPGLRRYRELTRECTDWNVDPREPGPLWWGVVICELRVRLVAKLPAKLDLEIDGERLRVRPLADLNADWPDVAGVAQRASSTSSASTMV